MWMDAKGSTVLSDSECLRQLALVAGRGQVGRLGISTGQAPVIIPVNFTVVGRHLLLRAGEGFTAQAANHQLVAFEVDFADAERGEAISVLARGLARLNREPTPDELALAPQPLVPEPGAMVLTIRIDVLTGRRFILPGAASPPEGSGEDQPAPGEHPMPSFSSAGV
jgi:hypothetical protein